MTENGKENVPKGEIISNLKPEEFSRGDTPANITEKCLDLCCAYIGGSWCNATTSDVTVARIYGGISNQLYRITLADTVPRSERAIYADEPTDVTVKLYESKRLLNFNKADGERLNDTLILTIMSEVGLGPKVYGVFTGGFISKYHEHCKVGKEQMKDETILRSVAHTLAKVHHLSVPIRKEANWQLRQVKEMLAEAYEHQPVDELIQSLNLAMLAKYDIREEFQWLKNTVSNLNYPLVFCHNDYLGSNTLVTQPDNRILLIDLEYCSYGSRGYDLGCFLSQWGLEPNDYSNFEAPSDEIMKRFIGWYIESAEKIDPTFREKPENSLEAILYETKLFMGVFFFFWSTFFLKLRDNFLPAIPVDIKKNFKFAEEWFTKYLTVKSRL